MRKTLFFTSVFIFLLTVVFLPSQAQAATNIYYSVGQNVTDHKTGSPTLTVSSGVGTFSVAQTATNMGVGDKVTFNTSSVCYISSKTSTSVWNLITATGAACGDVSGATVNSIAHAFASIKAALGSNTSGSDALLGTGDLVAGDYILNIPVYYDSGADTSLNADIPGLGKTRYTTGPNNYIRIYTPVSTTTEANRNQRPSGAYDSTKYTLNSYFYGTLIFINNLRIEGLQMNKIALSAASTTAPINYVITESIISKSIDTNPAGNSIAVQYDDNMGSDSELERNLSFYNNIVTGWSRAIGGSSQPNIFRGTVNIYNNTFFDISGSMALFYTNGSGTRVKNNIFASTTNAMGSQTYIAGSDYNSTDNSSLNYTVTGSGNTHDRVSQTFSFVSTSTLDFHLTSSDTGAKNVGGDLSGDSYLAFSTDIDRESRPQQSVWDIGADEFNQTTVAPTVTTSAASNVATSTLTFNASITDTGGADASQSGFVYSTASDLSTVIATSTLGPQTGTASFLQNVTGLSANTTYYFRAYATNAGGTGYGSILSTTTVAILAPTVTTAAVSDVQEFSAMGNGEITATGGAAATSRGFVWGTSLSYGATTTISGSYGTGTFVGPITGLACNTLYHVRAFATNATGTSYGSDQTFTTSSCSGAVVTGLPHAAVYAPGWRAHGDYIITQHPGQYIKFAVDDTANVTLALDTSSLTSNIYVRSYVDGVLNTDAVIAPGSTTVRIASGLSSAAHQITFQIKALSQNNERWVDETTMLKITDVYLDSGATLSGPGGSNAIRDTYAIWQADSLGEYLNATPASNNANLSYHTLVSDYFDWEHEHRAFSGTGFSNTYTSNPALYAPGGPSNQPINAYDSSNSRLVGGKLDADILVIAMGHNDIGTVTGSALTTRVNETLTYARTIFDGSIYLVTPVTNGGQNNAITSGYQNYLTASSDSRVHLIDIGTSSRSTLAGQTIDGTHLSTTGHANAATLIQDLFDNAFDEPTAPQNVVAAVNGGQTTVSFDPPRSNGGSPITEYLIASFPAGYSATTSATTTIVTGLAGGTNYTFTVKATNAVGQSASSTASNSVDPGDLTPPTISSVASSTGVTTATITFTTNEAASSTIQYGTTISYGSASTSATTTSHTFNLTGLTSATTYHFKIFVTDAVQNTGSSTDYTFTTAAAPDTTAPVISSVASSTGASTATITWTTNEAASSTVNYGATSSYGSASTSATLTTSHSITLTGLTAATTYHFNVGGADASGNVSTSSDYTLTTAALPDTTDPILAEVTVIGTTTDDTPSYTFTSTEAGTISYGGSCSSSETAAISGSNTITFRGLANATYSNCTITVTDASSNASDPLSVTTFTVNAAQSSGGGGSRHSSGRRSTSSSVSSTPAASNAPASTPNTSGTTSYTRNLTIGSTGEDVRALQKFLNSKGFIVAAQGPGSPGSETAMFGYATQLALKNYQLSQGITPATGYFGPLTQASLSTTGSASGSTPVTSTPSTPSTSTFTRDLELGATGEDVRALQKFLNSNGFILANTGPGSPGNETTKFGDATKYQLMQFQKAKGIVPASGYFGPKTRALLQ